jgi:hypothetical protein
LPAKAALANPAPILAATSATVTGASNCRTDLSGSVIETMWNLFKSETGKQKSADTTYDRSAKKQKARLVPRFF